MYVSAEIRWFWPAAPSDLHTWFCDAAIHDCAIGDPTMREDGYFLYSLTELGIKRRGDGDIEIKGLVEVSADRGIAPFDGPIELWCKWVANSLTLIDPMVVITKRRWMRQFEGCNVEYTQLSLLGSAPWFTFGFEAFGSVASVAVDLRRTMQQLAARQPPPLTNGLCESYPVWLSRLPQRLAPGRYL